VGKGSLPPPVRTPGTASRGTTTAGGMLAIASSLARGRMLTGESCLAEIEGGGDCFVYIEPEDSRQRGCWDMSNSERHEGGVVLFLGEVGATGAGMRCDSQWF